MRTTSPAPSRYSAAGAARTGAAALACADTAVVPAKVAKAMAAAAKPLISGLT
jgi:hypothetical protein